MARKAAMLLRTAVPMAITGQPSYAHTAPRELLGTTLTSVWYKQTYILPYLGQLTLGLTLLLFFKLLSFYYDTAPYTLLLNINFQGQQRAHGQVVKDTKNCIAPKAHAGRNESNNRERE